MEITESLIINYLIEERFASNVESAEAIMNAMSDEWLNNLVYEDLGVDASKVASRVIGKAGRSPEQVDKDAANLRSNVVGAARAAKGALSGMGAGSETNRKKIESRRPQGALQKDVAARTARVVGK